MDTVYVFSVMLQEALVNYMSANQDLAKEYKYLQEDQLKWKSLALRELDKRVDMEVSIRDQKQVYILYYSVYLPPIHIHIQYS